jgi:hypothetical protein
VLAGWFRTPAEPSWAPLLLENQRLDLAVARGAAYYGMVRRGEGVKITAGLARSYYIGVEAAGAGATSAVCLAPAGVEEGTTVDLPGRTFELLIRQPVEFPLYVSSTRLTDRAGDVVAVDREQLTQLPPIRTVLMAGKKGGPAETLRVNLHAHVTEIGTLDVWCNEAPSERTWKLVFDVRSATQTDVAAHEGAGEREGVVDDATLVACRELLAECFGPEAGGSREGAEGLTKALERAAGARRGDWPSSLLRELWAMLMEGEPGRGKSPTHEARWLYLVGYCLRPGYGMAVDDWRVAQTWRQFQAKKVVHGGPQCRAEWLILWRRIAGGLTAGQQRAIAEPLFAVVRPGSKGKGPRGGEGMGTHELAEAWRLLGSLELLGGSAKIELGDLAAARLKREKAAAVAEAQAWALARLGARVPLYGPLNAVAPAECVEKWLERLWSVREPGPLHALAVMQLARRTGDRYRDIEEGSRREALTWLAERKAPRHFVDLVRDGGTLRREETGMVFGEALPRGLRLA